MPIYLGSQFYASPYWGGQYFDTAPVPMGPVVLGTDLATLLLAIQARIIAKGLYPATACAISLEEDAFPSYGDSFCLIAPGDQRVDQGQVAGGGRYLTAIEGEFEVRAYQRVALDHHQQDAQLLTHPTRGLLGKAHAIVNALQMFMPMDMAGNILVEEPIRLASEGQPIKYKKKAAEWAMVRLPFSMNYIMNLDTSVDV